MHTGLQSRIALREQPLPNEVVEVKCHISRTGQGEIEGLCGVEWIRIGREQTELVREVAPGKR